MRFEDTDDIEWVWELFMSELHLIDLGFRVSQRLGGRPICAVNLLWIQKKRWVVRQLPL